MNGLKNLPAMADLFAKKNAKEDEDLINSSNPLTPQVYFSKKRKGL